MKIKILFSMLLVLSISCFVWAAEDLGELAKKEKARREALEKQGKKPKVFTNEDISKLKSQIGIIGSSEPADEAATESAEPQEEGAAEAPAESGEAGAETGPEDTVDTGTADQQPVSNQELQDLRDQREAAQKELEEAKQAIDAGGLLHTRNVGDQFDKVGEAQRKLEEINRRIRELEASNNNN